MALVVFLLYAMFQELVYRAFKDYFNHPGLTKNVSTSVLTREAIDHWYFIDFQKSERYTQEIFCITRNYRTISIEGDVEKQLQRK